MKSIICFDVDMTLLNHKDWSIPESTMETIEKLRPNNWIVLATGRDMDSKFSQEIRDQIRPDAIIHLNGTKITVGSQMIYEHFFDRKLAEEIAAWIETTPYSIGLTSGGEDYYIHPETVMRHDQELWGSCYRNFKDFYTLPPEKIRTLAFIGNEEGANALASQFPQVKVHLFAEKRGADVVEADVSKAMGLKKLCGYYNVPIEKTVAFGDSMNDYDIIRAAGTGVAMGNAMEELKAAADYVTDAVDKDGIRNACIYLGLV